MDRGAARRRRSGTVRHIDARLRVPFAYLTAQRKVLQLRLLQDRPLSRCGEDVLYQLHKVGKPVRLRDEAIDFRPGE